MIPVQVIHQRRHYQSFRLYKSIDFFCARGIASKDRGYIRTAVSYGTIEGCSNT